MNIIQKNLEKVAAAAYQSAVETGMEKVAASKLKFVTKDLKDASVGALNILGLSNKQPKSFNVKNKLANLMYGIDKKKLSKEFGKTTPETVSLLRSLAK